MALWDRQPTDTDESFLWFTAYRGALPPRQLGRLRAPGMVTPSLQVLLGWYNSQAWRDRAAAWDAHLDSLKQAEIEALTKQSAQEIAAEHRSVLKEARELVQDQLGKMLAAAREGDAHFLKPNELTKMAESVIKLDRLIQGESTDRTEHEIDMKNVSTEDLRAFLAKVKKT